MAMKGGRVKGFIEEVIAEKQRVCFLLESDYQRIGKLHDGWLQKRTGKRKITYYEVNGKREPISKGMLETDPRVAEIKAYKFISKRIEILEKNLRMLDMLISKYNDYSGDSLNEQVAEAYRQIAAEYDLNTEVETANRNRQFRGRLYNDMRFVTVDGRRVRSMAEITIYNLLMQHGVPFEYEAMIQLNDGSFVAPDFVIKRRDGRRIFWEHVGMFGKKEYRMDFFKKLERYFYSDILPGANLILTFSTKEYEVDTSVCDKLIRKLILPTVKPVRTK